VSNITGYFEIFDLTIDHPCHNYVANGLVCHNKTPALPLLSTEPGSGGTGWDGP